MTKPIKILQPQKIIKIIKDNNNSSILQDLQVQQS